MKTIKQFVNNPMHKIRSTFIAVTKKLGIETYIKITIEKEGSQYELLKDSIRNKRDTGVAKSIVLKEFNEYWKAKGIIVEDIEDIVNNIYSSRDE